MVKELLNKASSVGNRLPNLIKNVSRMQFLCQIKLFFCSQRIITYINIYESFYSPHNSDSSSDKINKKIYNKNTKKINLTRT